MIEVSPESAFLPCRGTRSGGLKPKKTDGFGAGRIQRSTQKERIS